MGEFDYASILKDIAKEEQARGSYERIETLKAIKGKSNPRSGYLSLAAHPDQYVLKEILGSTTDEELWAAAKQYDFTALARRLPDSHRRHALKAYSKLLGAAVWEIR